MLARIIFCVVIAAAVLAVVLLATISPLPHRSGGHKGRHQNLRTFTVYIHPVTSTSVQQQQQRRVAVHGGEATALVFRHQMTAGPGSTSKTVGTASGFLLPAGEGGPAAASSSVFDMVHLAFDAPGLSGSLCVEASNGKGRHGRGGNEEEEELPIVGGTGAFAFARGHAVVRGQRPGLGATAAALQLKLSVSPLPGVS